MKSGGVISAQKSTIFIDHIVFSHNSAHDLGGGVMYAVKQYDITIQILLLIAMWFIRKDILELQGLLILSVLVHRESVTVILLKMVQTMAACSFLLRVVSVLPIATSLSIVQKYMVELLQEYRRVT